MSGETNRESDDPGRRLVPSTEECERRLPWILALVAVALVGTYALSLNWYGEIRVDVSAPPSADPESPTPLEATVSDSAGDPVAGVRVELQYLLVPDADGFPDREAARRLEQATILDHARTESDGEVHLLLPAVDSISTPDGHRIRREDSILVGVRATTPLAESFETMQLQVFEEESRLLGGELERRFPHSFDDRVAEHYVDMRDISRRQFGALWLVLLWALLVGAISYASVYFWRGIDGSWRRMLQTVAAAVVVVVLGVFAPSVLPLPPEETRALGAFVIFAWASSYALALHGVSHRDYRYWHAAAAVAILVGFPFGVTASWVAEGSFAQLGAAAYLGVAVAVVLLAFQQLAWSLRLLEDRAYGTAVCAFLSVCLLVSALDACFNQPVDHSMAEGRPVVTRVEASHKANGSPRDGSPTVAGEPADKCEAY